MEEHSLPLKNGKLTLSGNLTEARELEEPKQGTGTSSEQNVDSFESILKTPFFSPCSQVLTATSSLADG